MKGGSVSCEGRVVLGFAVGGTVRFFDDIDVGVALGFAVGGTIGFFDGSDVGVVLGLAVGGTVGFFNDIDVGVALGLTEDFTYDICKSEGATRDNG